MTPAWTGKRPAPYAELTARNRQTEQRRAQVKELEARIAALDRELLTAEKRADDLADQPDRQKKWQVATERRREEHLDLGKQLAAARER